MNSIHIIVEIMPFEELSCRPYLNSSWDRGLSHKKHKEVNIMSFILSAYATILTLAIWQEAQSDNGMHNANKA
jgi:hypothetical protein